MMMSIQRQPALRLETSWLPASEERDQAYTLNLKNLSSNSLANFTLCISGPGRVDPAVHIEGGTIGRRLSNFTEFLPPENFELEAGKTWTLTISALSWPFQHWTDGATGAYVAFADGGTLALSVEPTRSLANNAPLKRGAEIYPVPVNPPVPVAIVPWPNHVSVSGRRSLPPGFALNASDPSALAAAEAFTA